MKKQFKHFFVQSLDPYKDDIVVVVGMNGDEFREAMKQNKLFPKAQKELSEIWNNSSDELTDKNEGIVLANKGGTKARILWLKEWGNTWGCIDNLVHETNHVIHFSLISGRDMQEEMEALAYAQEYIFSHIRYELNRALKKWRKKK